MNWLYLECMFNIVEVEFGEVDIVCLGVGVYELVCIFLICYWIEIVVVDLDYSFLVVFGIF